MALDRFLPPVPADFDGSVAQSLVGWAPLVIVALVFGAGLLVGWVAHRRTTRRAAPSS